MRNAKHSNVLARKMVDVCGHHRHLNIGVSVKVGTQDYNVNNSLVIVELLNRKSVFLIRSVRILPQAMGMFVCVRHIWVVKSVTGLDPVTTVRVWIMGPVLAWIKVSIASCILSNLMWLCFFSYYRIDDIAFELFAMHCGIGRGIRQKKIPQKNDHVVNITNWLSLLRAPTDQNAFVFFLNAISSIVQFILYNCTQKSVKHKII